MTIEIGDFVRLKFGKKEGFYNRKAKIEDIDTLSEMGCHPDRYTVRTCKTGEAVDCVRQGIEKW